MDGGGEEGVELRADCLGQGGEVLLPLRRGEGRVREQDEGRVVGPALRNRRDQQLVRGLRACVGCVRQ